MFFNITTFLALLFTLLPNKTSSIIIHSCDYNTTLSVPLRNLSNVVSHESYQDITISLCTGNSVLDGDLMFFNKDAVRFVGEEKSVLNCRGNSAGISFENVSYIKFQGVTMNNCGSVHRLDIATYDTTHFSSSILIQNSSNISMLNSSILNSQGLGMVILQSYTFIHIINCNFENGTAKHSFCGGGGIFFQNYNTSCSMELSIINTHFKNNNASFPNRSTCPLFYFQNGGGLNLNLYGSEVNNVIKIQDCLFESNTAIYWGGGLNLVIANTSSGNNITVENCTFYKNKCEKKGGGGADIGYLFDSVVDFPQHNMILFSNTTFEANSAIFGGGILVYSTMAESHVFESNVVIFINCHWIKNAARYLSAVYLNLHNPG